MTQFKLNIDDVRVLAESQNIPYYNTTKLYYKKYAYNLTLKHMNIWHHAYRLHTPDRDINDIRQIHNNYNRLYNQFTELLDRKGIEHRTRREKHLNLYFDDPTVFKLAVKNLGDNIVELNGPANTEHLAAMKNNRKIVVRESLWYKKYRFKITYRGTSDFQESTVPAIVEFKKNLTSEEIKLSSNIYKIIETPPKLVNVSNTAGGMWSNRFGYRRIQPWNLCTVYLNSEDNFVLYKMMVSGSPESEQEILLLSEL